MEEFYTDSIPPQNKPKGQSTPIQEFGIKGESAEEIVAENVSQQLLSNAFEAQKKDNESQVVPNPKSIEQEFSQQLIEEPVHQNVDIKSEQRFSGIPIQQYIYDEEEEDEEESDEEYEIEPTEKQRKDEDLVAFKAVPDQKPENNNLFDLPIEAETLPKEEMLYHLSDDNILTAQNYGIGTDLRIGSTSSEPKLDEMSAYELNSEDPFSTPQKQKPDINKETEEEFERFVDKCEPFETIATDLEEIKPKKSVDLLDLDQSISQRVSELHSIDVSIKESQSMIDSMSDSEAEPNHALKDAFLDIKSDKGPNVLPSSAVSAELNESHIQSAIPESTNKSYPDFNPTPNLECFEPTLTSSTHHFEQVSHSAQPNTSSQPIETIEESPITLSEPVAEKKPEKQVERKEEIISKKMVKQGVEHAATKPTDDSKCSLSPVAELVYWRDPKKSGVVFGSGLAILLSLTVFSIISVIAYTSLAVLSVSLSFRIYKNILQAVQKTNEGHPFKEYLDIEITPSSERIHEIVDSVLSHMNCTLNKLRSVFLVEDIIDSLKFVVLFWCLTYIGSWFNGLTLIIVAYLGMFSLPKVYEMNKAQVDQYLSLASTQINDITSKIRAKIPFPAKKEKDN